MKKAVLLMLSLFSALSLMFLSCSTDSSGGGSDPEFDVTICDSSLNEKLVWERDSGKDVYIFVTSKNYLKDLEIKSITDDELNSVKFTVDDSIDIDVFNLYKIWLNGACSIPGTYSYKLVVCKKSNSDIKASIDFTVRITGSGSETESAVPVIKTQPVAGKKYYEAGETIDSLVVKAEISSGDITYQWYKDGNPISGANGASYLPTEKGEYYVVVSNSSDSTKNVKSNVVSIVILAEGELMPPTIITDLEDSVSYDKSSMIEEIKVVAKPDGTVNYQWYDNNNGIIIDATSASYKPTAFGSYYCKLWTVDGSKKSQEVISNTITIKESEISITINGLDKEAYLGDTLTVSVVTNVDTDSVTYQWINTHGNVSSGNDEIITGATSDSYEPTEEGYYTCRVTVKSKGGQEKSSTNGGICHVKEQEEGDAKKPVISTQPLKEVSCKEGETITLTVEVEAPADGGTLSYQWKKDGQSISGATKATYTKTDVTTEDAGNYTVDVTNTLSTGKSATTTSSAAKVSVSGGTGNIGGGFDFINN